MAIQIIRDVSADVIKRGATRSLSAKQNDLNSRFLHVQIQEDGQDITVDPSLTVILNVKRSDKATNMFYGTVNDDGTVQVPLTPWMLELAGTLECDISIVSEDPTAAKLTTMQFNIYVEASAVSDENIVDTEEYSILVDLLERTAAAEAEAKEAAEQALIAKKGAIEVLTYPETSTSEAKQNALEALQRIYNKLLEGDTHFSVVIYDEMNETYYPAGVYLQDNYISVVTSFTEVSAISLEAMILEISVSNITASSIMLVKFDRTTQELYSKPTNGIPKTDLASAVKTSLDKADTAYQKPTGGIPKADLAQDVRVSLGKADEIYALKGDLADLDAWHTLNKFDSDPVKINAIKSPYTIDEMLNNSVILGDGSIRTDGLKVDKGNLMSPLIEVSEGIYGLKVKCYGESLIIGSLGASNNGYGLFANDGVTPVAKASMVDKGNNIYLITVPSNAKYIRFVARKGSNDDTNLDKTLEAFNSWILLPDATDDITDDFFAIQAKENGNIDKIKRIDGSYLNIVDAEARKQVVAVNEKLDAMPTTFGRRTCAIFRKVCCIGDSYTAGYIMNSNGTAISKNDYSWVEHMKNLTGREYVNCGISGASSKTWLTDERGLAKAQMPENKAQAYLIGLQINDSNESTQSYVPVGIIEDIGTDAETYYGCMSKIVNEVFTINPLAHVFIQTQPKNYTGVHTPYREAVINIVSHFQSDGVHTNQVHLLDLLPYYKLYQAAGCNDSMVNGHFTAVGWEYCAEILAYAWSNYINQNPLKFQDVNLIPY